MLAIRAILHPTDFSEHSKYAFELACALARDYKARLTIVHVKAPVLMFDEMAVAPPPEPPSIFQELNEQLHQLRPPDANLPVDHVLIEGDPVYEILQLASANKCDLIVMGTQGRTGLGRLVMGSIAEQIVRKAACPVLTVKAAPHITLDAGSPAH